VVTVVFFASSSSRQGLSAALGHIPCKCGDAIQVYDPVYVTGETEGTDHATAFRYAGAYEIENPRGTLGVAQQTGYQGGVITVAFHGSVLVRKETGVALKGGDVVWLDECGYVVKQPLEVDEFLTTHSAGITHFQVLQDATVTDNVVYVKFLTDLSSRGVPAKIVIDPDAPEGGEGVSNLCDLYPFGPESSVVIHKKVAIKQLDALEQQFAVGEWRMATVIGDIAYTGSSGGAERPYIQTPNNTNVFGAILTYPNGPIQTAFTEAQTFFVSTPWGTRVLIDGSAQVNPIGYNFFADVVEGAYYYNIDKFYVIPSSQYPTSGNITNYKLYLAKSSDSLELADSASPSTLPSGATVRAKGFDNTTASSSSRSYFINKPFDCSYNAQQNVFELEHPLFV